MPRSPRFRRRAPGWRLVRVVGESMRPTLAPGDVLVLRLGAQPAPGDLVVADLPGDRGVGVKRVLRADDDGWWLERDNPSQGSDSWLFGAVPRDAVHGVVRARLWPHPGRPPRPPKA